MSTLHTVYKFWLMFLSGQVTRWCSTVPVLLNTLHTLFLSQLTQFASASQLWRHTTVCTWGRAPSSRACTGGRWNGTTPPSGWPSESTTAPPPPRSSAASRRRPETLYVTPYNFNIYIAMWGTWVVICPWKSYSKFIWKLKLAASNWWYLTSGHLQHLGNIWDIWI